MILRQCVESDAGGGEVDEGRPRHGLEEDREAPASPIDPRPGGPAG